MIELFSSFHIPHRYSYINATCMKETIAYYFQFILNAHTICMHSFGKGK